MMMQNLFATAPFGAGEKSCRMDKLRQSRRLWVPEGVHRYVERRSLFIA